MTRLSQVHADHARRQLATTAGAVLILCLILVAVEFVMRVRNVGRNVVSEGFLLNVCGELLGEFDPVLFWRLRGVKPSFEGQQEASP